MKLVAPSFVEYFLASSEGSWACGYPIISGGSRLITVTAVCLADATPAQAPPPPCVCPPVEPLRDRMFRREQIGTLPAGTVRRFTAACPTESTLIAGSCALSSSNRDRGNLVSAGFSKDMADNDVWECTWTNTSTVDVSTSVVAVCLRPPMEGTAPEAEPMAGRLVKVEQRDTLPAGMLFTHAATCADGDFLLRGGCTLEDPEAAPSDLSIFRSGFPRESDNRPNTWECGWNNPSSSTPTAIATALCLKPPSASP